MARYRDDPAAIRAPVRPDAVHRDVHPDPEPFRLEMERPFARSGMYVGHTSRVPHLRRRGGRAARHALVSGFGMIVYDRGLCAAAALLART